MEYRQNKAGWQPRIDAKKYEQDEETERLSFSSEMEVAKLSALPNLKVRFVSCNESAIKRWLSSKLEETVFSLTHELFMTKHHTVTLTGDHIFWKIARYLNPNLENILGQVLKRE